MPSNSSQAVCAGQASPQVEKTIIVHDALGLHARPAARIAQTAQKFTSSITLHYEDMTVNAKSILDILTLAAENGSSLTLRCEGMDADRAAYELASLFPDSPVMEE